MNRLLTLKLEGTNPRSWGRQHGEAFAPRVRDLAGMLRELLAHLLPRWSSGDLDRLCDDHLAAMRDRWPAALAELAGIGEAAAVSLKDLVILNAYTDLKDFREDEGEGIEGGCSLVAAKGPHVSYSGQTWDMHGSTEPFTVLLEIPHAVSPVRLLTLTGCLALGGVNGNGVSVMINDLKCRETDRRGLVWPALVRLLLEQSTARAAVATLAASLPSSGHNYLISDRDEAINVETTGRRYEVTASIARDRYGYIGHTNHYLGSLKAVERTREIAPTSVGRLEAVQRFFGEHPVEQITTMTLVDSFFRHGPLCEVVCRPGSPTKPHVNKTCAGIGVDHAACSAFAFRGRYDEKAIEWSYGT